MTNEETEDATRRHLPELLEREARRRIIVLATGHGKTVYYADQNNGALHEIAVFRTFSYLGNPAEDAEGYATKVRERYVQFALGSDT